MPRSDNDTWDLASSVGATATLVAAARAIATKADAPLIDDRFAEPLVRAVGIDFFTRWVAGELTADDLDDAETGWGLSLMPNAMAVRTRFFDGFLADATSSGIRQVVILASGLDSRAYRLAWPAGTVVYEIDQPEVIAFKSATLAGLGANPTTELRSVAIDLRQDWPTALRDAGFDPALPSAWIAEGLFGYLPPEAQDRLLDQITALSAPASRLATEAVPSSADPDDEAAKEMLARATAKWSDHGFDLDFGDISYTGERTDVATHLADAGWQSTGQNLSALLTAHGVPDIRVDGDADTDAPSMADTVYYTSTLAG